MKLNKFNLIFQLFLGISAIVVSGSIIAINNLINYTTNSYDFGRDSTSNFTSVEYFKNKHVEPQEKGEISDSLQIMSGNLKGKRRSYETLDSFPFKM
jgi:hypothetical protein